MSKYDELFKIVESLERRITKLELESSGDLISISTVGNPTGYLDENDLQLKLDQVKTIDGEI